MAPTAVSPGFVLLAVIVVIILARSTYAMIQGARYSIRRIVVFTGVYFVLFALLASTTVYAAVGTWGAVANVLVVAYVAVPVAAAWFAAPYVRQMVRFEERVPGGWFYFLPWYVPVLTLALFVVRYLIEIVLFGLAYVTSFALPASLPAGLLLLLVAVDLLFGASLGLMAGRGIGVYRAYGDLPRRPNQRGGAFRSL